MFRKEKLDFSYYRRGVDDFRFRDFHANLQPRQSKVLNQEDTHLEENVVFVNVFDYRVNPVKEDVFVRKALLSETFSLARDCNLSVIEFDANIRVGRGEESPQTPFDKVLHDQRFQDEEGFAIALQNSRLVEPHRQHLGDDRMFYMIRLTDDKN